MSAGSRPVVVRLGDVGSTNDEAMTRLRADGGPLWVTAERQLAGRGRRGRPWTSPLGNLYASYGFACELDPAAVGVLPLAAAVALADAIAGATGMRPALKWPNDVLVVGRKVSGILIESEFSDHLRRVVIGFGVNIAAHPEETGALPAASLAEFAPELTPDDLHARLAPGLVDVLAELETPPGIALVRRRWLDRAVGLGRPVTVRFEQEERHGTFAGLDPDGRLILQSADGVSLVAAGDVFLATETI